MFGLFIGIKLQNREAAIDLAVALGGDVSSQLQAEKYLFEEHLLDVFDLPIGHCLVGISMTSFWLGANAALTFDKAERAKAMVLKHLDGTGFSDEDVMIFSIDQKK